MIINDAEHYRRALAIIEFLLATDPNSPQLFALRPAVDDYKTRQASEEGEPCVED